MTTLSALPTQSLKTPSGPSLSGVSAPRKPMPYFGNDKAEAGKNEAETPKKGGWLVRSMAGAALGTMGGALAGLLTRKYTDTNGEEQSGGNLKTMVLFAAIGCVAGTLIALMGRQRFEGLLDTLKGGDNKEANEEAAEVPAQ